MFFPDLQAHPQEAPRVDGFSRVHVPLRPPARAHRLQLARAHDRTSHLRLTHCDRFDTFKQSCNTDQTKLLTIAIFWLTFDPSYERSTIVNYDYRAVVTRKWLIL